MKPNQVVKAGVLVLVIAAVVVVLLLKQADSPTSPSTPAAAIGSPALADQSRAAPIDPPGGTDVVRASSSQRSADRLGTDVTLPRLLDLGADKCIPCKKMAPILEALREDFAGQFDVVFIDVWKNKQEAGRYGISLIPTQIFFDASGIELFRHQGFFSRDDILGAWSELGYEFEAPAASARVEPSALATGAAGRRQGQGR